MKYHWDKKYLYWGVTGTLVLCGAILFYYALFKGADISIMWRSAVKILMPILDGLAIAYLLSFLLNAIEKKILYPLVVKMKFKITEKTKKIIRNIGVFLTAVIFLLLLYGLIMMIVPQLLSSIQSIIARVPSYFNKISIWLADTLKNYPEIEKLTIDYWADIENWLTTQALPTVQKMVSQASNSLLGGVWTLLVGTWDFILGFIISIYLLSGKEKFCAQLKKVIYAFLKEERANTFLNNLRFTNKTFGGFLTGKILDSLIIGLLCYAGMRIFKLPYALLVSVIVGITNVIPFFGPYLGAVPSAIIIFMVSPVKALYFLIFVLILQQFDGNVLGPKILGDSTGLSSFWVIFSITIFGGILGILGMFIGVPLFAVIYAAFKTVVNQKLEKRGLTPETTFYMSSSGNPYASNASDHSGASIRFSKSGVKVTTKNQETVSTVSYERKNTDSKEETDHKQD